MSYEWSQASPESGKFFFTRHDRMAPTMSLRLGDEIFYFGEDLIDKDQGRKIKDMPPSTEYTGSIPTP
jgi:hypothetical protein